MEGPSKFSEHLLTMLPTVQLSLRVRIGAKFVIPGLKAIPISKFKRLPVNILFLVKTKRSSGFKSAG